MELVNNLTQHWGTWAASVALTVLVFGLGLLVKSRYLAKPVPENPAFKKTHELMRGLFTRTGWLFFLALSLYMGSLLLKLPDRYKAGLDQGVFLVLLLQVGWWGSWWLRYWAKTTYEEVRETDTARATAVGIMKVLGQSVLWLILILAGLANMGFEVSTLIAGLGVGGIAIALASQKILGDLFASMTLILDRPFVVGDFIICGDIRGNVEQIGLKTTHIRSLGGELLILSNSDILESRVQNFKKMKKRRALLSLRVTYQTSLEHLKNIPGIVKEIIESQEGVKFDRAHFKEYGPYSLNFEIVFFVEPPDYKPYLDTLQNVNLEIFERFGKEGIQFAYPTQTIQLDGASNKESPFQEAEGATDI